MIYLYRPTFYMGVLFIFYQHYNIVFIRKQVKSIEILTSIRHKGMSSWISSRVNKADWLSTYKFAKLPIEASQTT